MSARILAFAGSLRRESFNKKLVRVAAAGAEAAGASITHLDLEDLALPVFDEDLEAKGTPENVMKLKKLLIEHDGFLIGCPEYNSSITAALKNAIDWASRPAEGEKPLEAFRGKVAGLVAASPGGLGGLRGLVTVRSILGNIGVWVCPDQYALGTAHEAFTAEGDLKDDRARGIVHNIGSEVSRVAAAIR